MKTSMKKVWMILIFVLAGVFSFSQNKENEKFNILTFGNVKDIAFYIKSINASNLENWRLQDKRSVLKFDTGFEMELLSANELKKKGFNVDPSQYKTEFPSTYKYPLFNVFPNGIVGAALSPSPTIKIAPKK